MAEKDKDENPLAISSKKPKSKFNNFFKSKNPKQSLGLIFLALILVAGAIFAGLKISDNLVGDKKLQTIVIGDTTITPEDVANYANMLKEEAESSDIAFADINGDREESVETIALRDLVLNAALKKEGKENNIQLSEDDIQKSIIDEDVSSDPIIQQQLDQEDEAKITERIPRENKAYQAVLSEKIIVQKDLLLAFVNYDTPYHKSVSPDELEEAYNETTNRLKEIKQLMENEASAEQIAEKVDLDFINNTIGDPQDIEQYQTGIVVALDKIEDYSPGTIFNDIDAPYLWADKEEVFGTNEKLSEELVNVGDVSSVFAAKNGMHTTARLEGSNNGKYNSWDKMLEFYFNEHVKYASNVYENFVADANDFISDTSNKAVLALTSPGLERANAQKTCSQREVNYKIIGYIKDKNRKSGRTVDANVGINGARPKISFDGQNKPGDEPCVSNPDVRNGFVQIGDEVFADCLYSTPDWGGGRVIDHPQPSATASYNFWGLRVGYGVGDPWASPEIPPAPNQINSTQHVNGSGNFAPAWTPSTANLFPSTIYIFIIYERETGTEPPGDFYLNMRMTSDCNIVIGTTYYRDTNGSRKQARWHISGPQPLRGNLPDPSIPRWTVGPTLANKGFEADTYRFFQGLGGSLPNGTQIPTGVQIWGESSNYFRNFHLTASLAPGERDSNGSTPTPRTVTFKINSVGCGPELPPDPINPTINCNTISFTARDPNAANVGRTTRYIATVYFRDSAGRNSGAPAYRTDSRANGRVSINYNIPPQLRAGHNYGYNVVIQVYGMNKAGNDTGIERTESASVGACWSASCTISIGPNVPTTTNGVQVNSTFRLNATFRNTGQKSIPGNSLSATYYNTVNNRYIHNTFGGGDLNPGETRSISRDITAPSNVTQMNFYADYAPLFPVGNTPTNPCYTVDVYGPFDVSPTSSGVDLNPDEESPTGVTFNWGMSNNPPLFPVNNVRAEKVFTRDGAPMAPNPTSTHQSVGSVTDSETKNITTDSSVRYCARLTVSPAEGFVGPLDRPGSGQVVVTRASDSTPESCADVGDKPYVRVYGGDVNSGVAFTGTDGSCTIPANSGVFGNTRPAPEHRDGGKTGSGTQLAVFAQGGDVNGFVSAFLRNTRPPLASRLNGLTFANNVSTPGANDISPLLGKAINSNVTCMPDYYNKTQFPDGDATKLTGAGTVVAPGSLVTEKQTIFNVNGNNVTVNSVNNYDRRHTVYVDGDAIITGDINYRGYNASGGNIGDIPNFTLIAKGNIYINKNVQNLDGTYIAQPRDDGSRGNIYTCATNGSPETSSVANGGLYTAGCDNQLRVNGTFLANKIVLNRIANSIRDSEFRELSSNSDAAEIFTFSPDIYLSPPVFRPNSTVTSGDYEYITSLPPVL